MVGKTGVGKNGSTHNDGHDDNDGHFVNGGPLSLTTDKSMKHTKGFTLVLCDKSMKHTKGFTLVLGDKSMKHTKGFTLVLCQKPSPSGALLGSSIGDENYHSHENCIQIWFFIRTETGKTRRLNI